MYWNVAFLPRILGGAVCYVLVYCVKVLLFFTPLCWVTTPLAEWDLNALLQFFCDSINCVYMPLSSPWTDEAVSILRLWLSMK